MIKELDPVDFIRRLYHYGPYIYFYTNSFIGADKSIEMYINKMSSKYPDLQVFSIDWRKYCDYYGRESTKLINKVFLHCKNQIVDERFMTDTKEIDEIFKKAIELYNINVENKAKNIGTRAINVKLYGKDDSYKLELKKRMKINDCKRRKMLESKIFYKNDMDQPENENIKNECLSKNEGILIYDKFQKNENSLEFLKETNGKSYKDSLNKPIFNNTNKIELSNKLNISSKKTLQNLIKNDDSGLSKIGLERSKSSLQFSNLSNNVSSNHESYSRIKSNCISEFPISNEVFSYDAYFRDDKPGPKSLKKYILKRHTYNNMHFNYSHSLL